MPGAHGHVAVLRVIGAGSGQLSTDRLNSVLLTVSVDVVDDHFEGQSSSVAKEADADLRIIEFARRSSLFCCSSP